MQFEKAYLSQPAAVLVVSGEDHAEFLHNQGTQDLQGPDGFCRYTLWLDHKGNIHADSFVLKKDEGSMVLISHACPAESLIQKFERHIIADDVTIENQTENWQLISVPGQGGRCRKDASFLEKNGLLEFGSQRLGPDTLEILIPSQQSIPQIQNPINEEEAEYMRLINGTPLIPTDTDGASLNPVEARLLHAVSFDKGCYLGQEVVTRVHRLGRVPRRLVKISGAGKPMECPFDLLENEKLLGRITSVAKGSNGFIGIGWLKSKAGPGPLLVAEKEFEIAELSSL